MCPCVPVSQLIIILLEALDCSPIESGDIYLFSEPTGRASLRLGGWLSQWGYHCRLWEIVEWTASVAGSGGIRRCPLLLASLPGLSPSLDVVVSPSLHFLWWCGVRALRSTSSGASSLFRLMRMTGGAAVGVDIANTVKSCSTRCTR